MKLILAISLSILCGAANAAGDAAAGKAQAAVCAGCHGANGVSAIPNYPNLAGQKAAYLVEQLKAFKSGARKGANAAVMAPMAAGLSDQAMKDLAAYYASMDAAK